jgi:hypothetical protein
VLIAGTNVVATSAVAVAAMNYDPRAARGTVPFEFCDNKLLLAEKAGVGTCDLNQIELIGPPIKDIMFDFRALRETRRAEMNKRWPGARYYGGWTPPRRDLKGK